MVDFSGGVRRVAFEGLALAVAAVFDLDALPPNLCRLDDFADHNGSALPPSKYTQTEKG